ncbi:hypothetical protein Nepgr_015844 [Nepenthes gracilis]|uniref:Uncharacterized protein n=1 Tax=Nepenthes gracilis TaxID=150966 RepID=A0AAD3SMG6_NEPGR|nr:hypothetical protein Nepgr_015844 [Nepenthes gracilis]
MLASCPSLSHRYSIIPPSCFRRDGVLLNGQSINHHHSQTSVPHLETNKLDHKVRPQYNQSEVVLPIRGLNQWRINNVDATSANKRREDIILERAKCILPDP